MSQNECSCHDNSTTKGHVLPLAALKNVARGLRGLSTQQFPPLLVVINKIRSFGIAVVSTIYSTMVRNNANDISPLLHLPARRAVGRESPSKFRGSGLLRRCGSSCANRRQSSNSSPMFTEAKVKVCENLIALGTEFALKELLLRNTVECVNTILGRPGRTRANLQFSIFGEKKKQKFHKFQIRQRSH